MTIVSRHANNHVGLFYIDLPARSSFLLPSSGDEAEEAEYAAKSVHSRAFCNDLSRCGVGLGLLF